MLPQELTFQVREEPVYNQHGTKLDGYKQLVKDENNELIAVHKNTTESSPMTQRMTKQ